MKNYIATIETSDNLTSGHFSANNLEEAKRYASSWKRREYGHKGKLSVRLEKD